MNKNLEKLSTLARDHEYEALKKVSGANNVNHPAHYNRPNSMECIDEMLLVFGRKAVMNFCLCNAWKYRYRAADKNGAEDLAKSDWYIAKYKELKNGKTMKAVTSITLPTYETVDIPCNTKVETRNVAYINNNEYDPRLVQ